MSIQTSADGRTRIDSQTPKIEPLGADGIEHQLQIARLYIPSMRFGPNQRPELTEAGRAELRKLHALLHMALPKAKRTAYPIAKIQNLIPLPVVESHATDFVFEQVIKLADLTMNVGEAIRSVETMNDPRFGPLRMNAVFTLLGRLKCPNSKSDSACVELEVKTDVIDFPIKRIDLKALGLDVEGTIEKYDSSTQGNVVFEPIGLIPHLYSTRRNALVTLRLSNGPRVEAGTRIHAERRFGWTLGR